MSLPPVSRIESKLSPTPNRIFDASKCLEIGKERAESISLHCEAEKSRLMTLARLDQPKDQYAIKQLKTINCQAAARKEAQKYANKCLQAKKPNCFFSFVVAKTGQIKIANLVCVQAIE